TAFFFGGELVVVNANGMADIAQLVKEATLLGGAKVNGVECCAEAGTAIMDDEFEAIFAPDAQRFQFAEESQPVAFILLVGQTPGDDFGVFCLWPDSQRNQNRALDTALDRSSPAFVVEAVCPRRDQL